MIRLFRVYYPLRALVLLAVEALIVYVSFVLATILQNRENWWILLNVEDGYLKIVGVTVMVLLPVDVTAVLGVACVRALMMRAPRVK